MRAKIGSQLLARIKPAERHYEICDTELKGFTLRIQPSGVMSFVVRYRKEDGKTTRAAIAQSPVFTPAQARDEARLIPGQGEH